MALKGTQIIVFPAHKVSLQTNKYTLLENNASVNKLIILQSEGFS
jgi:hypothetical protein